MSVPTAVLLSWSGGKDAAWALHALGGSRDLRVVGLMTTLTREHERVSMQGLRREVLHAQAEACGLPLVEAWIDAGGDNAAYEASVAAAFDEARERWPGLRSIAYGDLLLREVRDWRHSLCRRLGWQALFPLFGTDTTALARTMIQGGLRATICCVDTTQLSAAFAGRTFDPSLLDALPPGVDACGENGEFHTVVSDGPMFRHRLRLATGETVLREARFVYTDFLLAD